MCKLGKTRKCYDCGKQVEGRVENYKYTECGLQSITLCGVMVFHCECGAIVPEILAISDLHRLIFLRLLAKNGRLLGEEIRFLRKMAGLSATDLSRMIGANKVSMSNWETDKKVPSEAYDRFIRTVCFLELVKQDVHSTEGPEAAASLSKVDLKEFDISSVLRDIKSGEAGPERVTVNPSDLSRFGPPTNTPELKSVQGTVQ